ncbi:hypothetical protein CLOSTASPAR_03083 [[Clostridium] asparagiforme DSM 15981]|uniref:Uncharacterized protein n=1 Tax=[Clostridium] asparagiforme DSM 15981 TaxID=518636 RepID=C0D1E5_9FIRM|nr:hypothetical protein CLOSTASPAR_03083 [[Clostridium] asparagiforme DSM 15981]
MSGSIRKYWLFYHFKRSFCIFFSILSFFFSVYRLYFFIAFRSILKKLIRKTSADLWKS